LLKDKKHIAQFLEKIAESNIFSKSPVNRELLKYLTDSSVKGEKPKEFQIASDVFGKKYDADKEVNVRVYIHNLRKKLKEYYQREGKDDELVFELPKGQYSIHFKHSAIKSYKKKIYRFSPVLLAVSTLLLVGSLLLHVLVPANKVDIQFWNNFLTSGFPTRLVLGDHYFYRGIVASGETATIRDSRINTDQDFDNFLRENPELIGKMDKTALTYINNQAPLGLFYLMQLFGGKHFEIDMDYSSRIKIDDFRDRSLLFIGSFKTLQQLRNTVEKLGLVYNIEETLLEYKTAGSTFTFDNRTTSYLSYEHATVSHFELPDGRRVLFFLCDLDIGNMALLKYFTDQDKMKSFTQKLQELGSSNFKAVFEVKGQNRTDFDISLLRLDLLPENIAEIWP
jgi:hypothetical protein